MIVLDRVSKTFDTQPALLPTTLRVAAGAVTVLIGPSGCGKSTVLRLIAGLLQPDSGRIEIDGIELDAANVNRMRHAIGYVIQDGGLFPHLTARQNLALLARFLKRPRSWMAARIEQLCALANLREPLLMRYPQQLSGGQRQRVALMRALMLDPPLLLLDEPLGALDPLIRAELQTELKALFAQLGKTVLLVTHDMNEAAHFADNIVLMREGRIVQQGSLDDLLKRPAEAFVYDFIRAQKTILDAKIREAAL